MWHGVIEEEPQQVCPNAKLQSEMGYTSATPQNHPKKAKNKMADFLRSYDKHWHHTDELHQYDPLNTSLPLQRKAREIPLKKRISP